LGEDNQAKPYVRHFTAEAFAFLLRKARGADLAKIIKCILDTLRAEPSQEFEEGLAMLFFESIKVIYYDDSVFEFKVLTSVLFSISKLITVFTPEVKQFTRNF
jgi:hypothetical protein